MESHPEKNLIPKRQELHPLFNDLTLAKILSHLSLSTLLECRLVCKTWSLNPEITHRIQTQITIHLSSYSILDNFLSYLSSSLAQNYLLPFTRFDLDFTRQCHPLCDSSHALTQVEEAATLLGKGKLSSFFSVLKEHPSQISIKYLKLTLDKTHLDRDGLVDLLLGTPSVSEHLETLYIYNLSHRAVFSAGFSGNVDKPRLSKLKKLIMDEIRIAIPVFIGEFLSFCPNLEEIVLRCDKRSDWQNQAGIWKEHSPLASSIIKGLVNSWGCGSRTLKLKAFSCGILDQSHFQLLTRLGEGALRLNLLEIYCPAKDVDAELLKSFLLTQSKTLKVLRILGNVDKLRRAVGNNGQEPGDPAVFVLELPKMEALESFQLSGRDKDTPLPVKGLEYGTKFPRLSILIVNGFATNIGDKMDDYFPCLSGQEPCRTLRKLVLPAEIRNSDILFNVERLFPCVTRLEVKYPDNAFLSKIFPSFQGLEELRILTECGPSIEEGFIGESGILSLSRLKVLEITVETEHREVPDALNDSVMIWLRKMRNLRKLVLLSCCWLDGVFPCNFLSKNCQKDLVKQLENCVIIFTPLGESSGCLTSEENENFNKIAGFYGS